MTDKEIANIIGTWIRNNPQKRRSDNPVWAILRKELKITKHWKDKDRGISGKTAEKIRNERVAKENGYGYSYDDD